MEVKTKAGPVSIRWFIRRDLPEVLAIENRVYQYPWTEAQIIETLRHRNCIGMVAELCDTVVGYVLYDLHRDHLDLLSVAVDWKHHGQGIGWALVCKVKSKLRAGTEYPRLRLEATVREYNEQAHLFFKRQGFIATEIVRAPFLNSSEDAYRFEYFYDEREDEKCRRLFEMAMA